MRPVDIGVDAARILTRPGSGRVRAVFSRALYLDVPGGLIALCSTQVPRGPLHLRMTALPAVLTGCPVLVATGSLRIGDHACPLTAPVWAPRLPPVSTLRRVHQEARDWLPGLGPTLDLGPTLGLAPAEDAGLPGDALAALRRGDLLTFAGLVGGRGAGLTPAGDDLLAGVLLVACALRDASPTDMWMLRRCAHGAPTNDIARAFLACAARGRCIEPAHALLNGLADADRRAVQSAADELRRFGSSSGAALTYGIRTALLELPNRAVESPRSTVPPPARRVAYSER
jgi:hypothetical protein